MEIKTPRWAIPLLEESRYKGAKGGRGSGKSHFFAELAVESMVMDPNLPFVCIREIQKSLKFSAKRLIEAKISALGVGHLFDITTTEIRRKGGDGIFIFQGMQDHTADSIKSLEGFKRAWVEEAQNLSARSLKLLRPTIREEGSEIWFSWNPDQPDDPVEDFFKTAPDGTKLVHVNIHDNPFAPETLWNEHDHDRRHNPDSYDHVWLGAYNKKAHAQIFRGKWVIDEFTPGKDWQGPYHGLDFGFSTDPTAGVRVWIHENSLFVEYDAGQVGLELDDTAPYLSALIPGIEKHVVRADSARPESISYLKRNGLPRIEAVLKGKGSVEDGIEHMKTYRQIVIHPRCEATAREFRLYSYKVDQKTGDILPVVLDEFNHYIDAIRYALEPIIKSDDPVRRFLAMTQ